MTTMNIAQAKAKLSELVARAQAGEEVVLTRNGKPAAKLVAAPAASTARQPRALGLWDHLGLELDEDVFFKPDLELEEAMESSRIFPSEE